MHGIIIQGPYEINKLPNKANFPLCIFKGLKENATYFLVQVDAFYYYSKGQR